MIYKLPDGGCSLEMIQFLATHGARLFVTPEDSTPFDFANHLLREGSMLDLLAKIKYVLGTLIQDKPSPRLPSFLLESCGYQRPKDQSQDEKLQLEIFEYLLRKGADVRPGSPLAVLVSADGREELVRDVLYSGSDLNAYWTNGNGWASTPLQIAAHKGNENLVRLFLREGANVNSPARNDYYGMTVLHAICLWSPATEEEHQRKMRICLLLINQGADVNPPRSKGLPTILGSAATHGDLELAVLLLREGADINATSGAGTALDWAAISGRLDMVKFLLNANASSCVRGATGYDGAIYRAEKQGHLAVADLIREHAAKVEAGTIFNPELLKPQDERRVLGFGTDDGSSDDNYESSSDDDADSIRWPVQRYDH
ncbi:ankyrin repeat-containing domain protein [Diaporthe sp. PMI_573]|nr:ankyrin repeat-containing domain protein [Diaporthaceae sp. PMI_573]